ncbi:MAG: PAS domain-containing sensor histidine kinase [Thermodesulfovibrionales bacterium]|nr:PAS domain-containing sensor histidine kinase [Thermodesulfovibrionales bacterium]
MDSDPDRQAEQLLDMALGNEQFKKYAKDLVTAYRSEKKSRKELDSAYETLHAIIESISEGVVATDEGFKVIEANQSLCRLLEIKKEHIINRSLPDFLDPPEGKGMFADMVHAAGDSGRFEINMESSSRRVFGVSVDRLTLGSGYVMVFVDVTAVKRAEKMKSEFLSILSHELNTPLNGIIGLSDILSDELKGKVGEEQYSYIQDLVTCGNRMTATVKELVHFAELQGRALEDMNQKVEIWDVIEEALRSALETGNEKNIAIKSMREPSMATVTGNAMMLEELFFQILDNAVVFGNPDGQVQITVNNRSEGSEITISDDGIGIPASELERVFDSFYQVEEHHTRSKDGLGLGLPLAKRIVELHGGHINLESALDKGTTCRITLPYQQVAGYIN